MRLVVSCSPSALASPFSLDALADLLPSFLRDLALYQDTIATFSLSALDSRFEMLRQLGNVFIVQPQILKSYLTEAYLGRIENRLLRPYVMCRTDYGDFGRKFWEDILGDDAATAATAPASGSKLGMAPGWGGISSGATFGDGGDGKKSTVAERKQSIFGGLMKEFSDFGIHDHRASMQGGSI